MTSQFLLPSPEDNVAIVTQQLDPGSSIRMDSTEYVTKHSVPAGHRIAVREIASGENLLSWGLPFGRAIKDIKIGEHVCNSKVARALQERGVIPPGDLNGLVNFVDQDTVNVRQLPSSPKFGKNETPLKGTGSFDGYFRGHSRGWGTRNYIAVIAASSLARSTVLNVADRLAARFPPNHNFDGVVPVVHTEGGTKTAPANLDLVVRTLAGFAVNPNVGAAIIINHPDSPINNESILREIQRRHLSPVEYTLRFLTFHEQAEESLTTTEALVAKIAPKVLRAKRSPVPLSELSVGMQCGGSDAFSGVTANPVLGNAMHTLIQHGGTVGIAETDELIGSEPYTLKMCESPKVFEQFLEIQTRFKRHVAKFGHSAEGNPSGGNMYRGLYNITLKSIGAARKKDPRTSLHKAIDYATPMTSHGLYFMDSPGNDIESVAGQVASGATVIAFTTGNGSITNFPFVPTVKVVTTTERYRQLQSDMDFDAGRVIDGHSIADLGDELFSLITEVASGRKTKGENSGQFQTQIWRNWFNQTEEKDPETNATPSGIAKIAINGDASNHKVSARFRVLIPTSLCSGQVCEQIVRRRKGDDRFGAENVTALAHTEGCGVTSGASEEIYSDVLIGYATHPLTAQAVFVEHGCEKTHNDYFKQALRRKGYSIDRFEWTSIQGTGGIKQVSNDVAKIFEKPIKQTSNTETLTVGIITGGFDDGLMSRQVARLANCLLRDGISVVIPDNDPILRSKGFGEEITVNQATLVKPSIGYGERIHSKGLHTMKSYSDDRLELMTGMGACGASVFAVFVKRLPWQPHRFIPTIQIGKDPSIKGIDSVINVAEDKLELNSRDIAQILVDAVAGDYQQKISSLPNVGFQITRGPDGISM